MPDTHHLAYEAADPAIHLLKQKQVLAVSCVIADSGISAHKAHVTDLPCASEEKHLVIDPPVVITVCRTRLAGEQKCNGGAPWCAYPTALLTPEALVDRRSLIQLSRCEHRATLRRLLPTHQIQAITLRFVLDMRSRHSRPLSALERGLGQNVHDCPQSVGKMPNSIWLYEPYISQPAYGPEVQGGSVPRSGLPFRILLAKHGVLSALRSPNDLTRCSCSCSLPTPMGPTPEAPSPGKTSSTRMHYTRTNVPAQSLT